MSDERDGADATADAAETEQRGGRTAVATRPPRPTGKRSRQRPDHEVEPSGEDGADVKVKAAKKAKKVRRGPSVNPIAYVYNYLKQVVAELRKVIWPNRKQMITYTSVVLVFLVFMVAVIGLVDLGVAKLVMLVFG
ncbi:preprotein translocase subunit SecE [Mycobacterium sp.]|uniref:preprotein translocase subunit SecE n=1 Tax=Mycobacterium sp. TaxID=1785 RepID=UPI0031CF848B